MSGLEYRRVVLGIGNPGRKYAGTRHNLGFEALEKAAGKLGLELARPFGTFLKFGKTRWVSDQKQGCQFFLFQPLTYVNRSGDVAKRAVVRTGVAPEEFFVVCDDLNIPPGQLRIRRRGSDGGHNGLRSIGAALGTDRFPRMRLGIGSVGDDVTGFVLGKFTPAERDLIEEVVERAAVAIVEFVEGCSLDYLMNKNNKK